MTVLETTDPQLVFDLGMNNGDDTDYYLKRGLRVVALEANPALCRHAEMRFAEAIHDQRLVVVHAAIWSQTGETRFFVNLDNDHWSSIDIGWAGRDDSRCKEIMVRCCTLPELFKTYGVPHYLKIDVEGVDTIVLDQLLSATARPDYVSVEDCRFGYDYLASLAASGYTGFKLLDQSTVAGLSDDTVGHAFPPGSSGPLGEEIAGDWLDYDAMIDLYSRTVRTRNGQRLAPRTHWWDIHASRTMTSRETQK
ncbi:FkbM family methyltransferase [Rhizobium sp. C4]|uniref:FkbM family methyltransferase n=1 Tax=Rhizobium sp. C4 TaxID=1349800 RepID=UPI001E613888|nr:FkbM family methyltransferase [Rhizobium sp. C4]MCD2173840.1 FkbM family methyltransferase [Rhizobium sp. C4]